MLARLGKTGILIVLIIGGLVDSVDHGACRFQFF
jgi:hypothetical protein